MLFWRTVPRLAKLAAGKWWEDRDGEGGLRGETRLFQWKALPKDLPPRSTVWEYLDLWDWDGTLERIHHALYVEVRENAGREASPTTAIIDSQTAKGAVNVWPAPSASGFCALI